MCWTQDLTRLARPEDVMATLNNNFRDGFKKSKMSYSSVRPDTQKHSQA